MKFTYKSKIYEGSKEEIENQVTIDLRDLLDYNPGMILKVLKGIPESFDVKIGNEYLSGTKEEILDQFIKVQEIAPIVCECFCTFNVLGIRVSVVPGEHMCVIRKRIISKVKKVINDI